MDMKKLGESLLPYLIVGVVIALCVGLLFMFFSVAIWGVLIGGILWLVALAKDYFFPNHAASKTEDSRVIEHEDTK